MVINSFMRAEVNLGRANIAKSQTDTDTVGVPRARRGWFAFGIKLYPNQPKPDDVVRELRKRILQAVYTIQHIRYS
ncbi:MAG TPA: hypothetical protein VMT42_05180 [candidate division Zixibacteria bacterium]|nr:hypothetical protein [candidate division Zixibacteria bacterium]